MVSEVERPKRRRGGVLPFLVGGSALCLGVGLGLFGLKTCAAPPRPLLPPMTSSVTVVRPTPDVLVAVRDLARLESAAFHMERVIDLSDKQSKLWGMVSTEDAILLVAVAEVTAGLDLQKLTAADVVVDPARRTARIELPAPEVLHAALDNEKTYVHSRKTGTLASRNENLESRARKEAERTLIEAARQAGLLSRAGDNARRTVEALVHSLGYDKVEVTVRAPNAPAPAAATSG
ncbi:MAG: DUF4230 domain-containing protein [Myxococcales bacterium]|nr:MAG: DUF4230 domain-containing protein [Myxococcales bacterium]